MTHEGLTAMTRIEVVIRGSDSPWVRELLTGAGVTGYTAVSNVSGLGHHGYHQGRLLFNEQASLEMLITVVPPERSAAIVAGLRKLFEERPGVMFVSDAYVSRPEYFA